MSTVNQAMEEIAYFLNLHGNENHVLFYSGVKDTLW